MIRLSEEDLQKDSKWNRMYRLYESNLSSGDPYICLHYDECPAEITDLCEYDDEHPWFKADKEKKFVKFFINQLKSFFTSTALHVTNEGYHDEGIKKSMEGILSTSRNYRKMTEITHYSSFTFVKNQCNIDAIGTEGPYLDAFIIGVTILASFVKDHNIRGAARKAIKRDYTDWLNILTEENEILKKENESLKTDNNQKMYTKDQLNDFKKKYKQLLEREQWFRIATETALILLVSWYKGKDYALATFCICYATRLYYMECCE